MFEQHQATLSHSEPVCDISIFDGLSPHPNVSTPHDSSLIKTKQDCTYCENFNFAPGLWIAVQPDEDETTDDFWIAKIITVQRQCTFSSQLMVDGDTMGLKELFPMVL